MAGDRGVEPIVRGGSVKPWRTTGHLAWSSMRPNRAAYSSVRRSWAHMTRASSPLSA
ncbi:hypothetical protein ACE2AJ_07485 [Aquihabitans daechungensis]|uniref:hypothetical protein n=1 Tax=Aquihabitans daechungensis TaxID=1052257 RepID=UPI003BA271E6